MKNTFQPPFWKKTKKTTNKTFGHRNGLKLWPPQPQVLNLRLRPQNFGLWSITVQSNSFEKCSRNCPKNCAKFFCGDLSMKVQNLVKNTNFDFQSQQQMCKIIIVIFSQYVSLHHSKNDFHLIILDLGNNFYEYFFLITCNTALLK